MRFSTTAIYTIALALAVQAASLNYKPYEGTLSDDSFFEQFDLDNNWKSKWIPSAAMKDNKLSYVGEWNVEEAIILPGIKNDKGLVAKSEASLHAISLKLPQIFNNLNNSLVLQYEVKFQTSLNCGGAYIKLLSAEGLDSEIKNNIEFSDKTPYIIMFGPDKCGNDNKVHFIIKSLNEKTGDYEEFQLKKPPMAKIVQTTSLYTLIIEPNQDFQIRINGDIVRSGNLLNNEDFDLLPPKEIIDINDTKPDDWIEEKTIIDINDVKPDDWDENAPYLIDDPTSIKPENWDENEPEQIPDPNDLKPEDWDDEEDGIWIQKLIDNPKCLDHGCGKWIKPKIKNPQYKGKWSPRLIPNPEYKGEWKPKLIPNPDYYEKSKKPSDLSPIGGLGFEIWTMDKNIMFDNIYLGHHIKEAEDIGNSTFIPKLKAEHALIIQSDPNVENPVRSDDKYLETPIISDMYEYALDILTVFFNDLRAYLADVIQKPFETLGQRPGEAFFFSSVIVGTFAVIVGFWTMIINICSTMINSYFETDKSAYIGPSKEVLEKTAKIDALKKNGKLETIEETKGSTESKANITEAKKR
jgi:calnexin